MVSYAVHCMYMQMHLQRKKVTCWLPALFNTSNACTGNVLGKISVVQIQNSQLLEIRYCCASLPQSCMKEQRLIGRRFIIAPDANSPVPAKFQKRKDQDLSEDWIVLSQVAQKVRITYIDMIIIQRCVAYNFTYENKCSISM